MLIGSKQRWALMVEQEETSPKDRLQEYIEQLDQDQLDLILVEGFKPEAIPKIELHRSCLKHPLISKTDKSIMAIAADTQIKEETDLPILDLNNHEAIVAFIIENFSLNKKQ